MSDSDKDLNNINVKKNIFNSFLSDSEDSELDDSESDKKYKSTQKQIVENIDNIEISKPEVKIIKKDKQIKKDKIKKNRFDILNEKKLVTLFSEKIELLINGINLVNESDLVINSDTKYFLIGKNGCGKTTLLRYIYEKIKDTQDILMIEQDIYIESMTQTINDFILEANYILYEKYKQMKILENKNELSYDENDEYNDLSEYVYNHEWDKYEAESKKILNGLGFLNPNDPVHILSGGWRMRLAIGKALLKSPNILFMDEPTNHLDLEAVIWLTDYLLNYKKTIVITTHQIGLVNTLADYTWFIDDLNNSGQKLYTVRGGYANHLQTVEQLLKEHTIKYEKFEKRINEFKKKSTPKKEIDEFIKKNQITRPAKKYNVVIEFEDVLYLNSKNIIQVNNLSFSYNNNLIFDNVNFSIQQDSRYIIVGNNGTGKTTLFKLCASLLKPSSGGIIRDDKIKIGYYHQQIIENLPLNSNSIDYLKSLDNSLDDGKCRGILGKIGLKKSKINDPCSNLISDLSGGQKARVALCALNITKPNAILMDEPTNHLDIESINGLIDGINNYNGAVVLITHDIYLIESIRDSKIIHINNKKINIFKGDIQEYCNFCLHKC